MGRFEMVHWLGWLMFTICSLAFAAERPSPSPAADPDVTIALFPVNKCKLLSLVRHAQGFRNQAKANATRDKTRDPPHAVLFENTTGKLYWDAELTKKGRKQCNNRRLNLLVCEAAFSEPEVVLVSPVRLSLPSGLARRSMPTCVRAVARSVSCGRVIRTSISLQLRRRRTLGSTTPKEMIMPCSTVQECCFNWWQAGQKSTLRL